MLCMVAWLSMVTCRHGCELGCDSFQFFCVYTDFCKDVHPVHVLQVNGDLWSLLKLFVVSYEYSISCL